MKKHIADRIIKQIKKSIPRKSCLIKIEEDPKSPTKHIILYTIIEALTKDDILNIMRICDDNNLKMLIESQWRMPVIKITT